MSSSTQISHDIAGYHAAGLINHKNGWYPRIQLAAVDGGARKKQDDLMSEAVMKSESSTSMDVFTPTHDFSTVTLPSCCLL